MQKFLSDHQNWVLALFVVGLWGSAYVWYFWKDLRKLWNADKPGRWYADMHVRKAGKGMKPPRM